MSSFALWIDTNNDAFHDDPDAEIARILRRAAAAIEEGRPIEIDSLLDINGNTVGKFVFHAGDFLEWVFAPPHDADGSIPNLVLALSERAEAIIADHRAGEHEEHYDDTIGCSFPGCEDAFWAWVRAQEAAR